MKQYNNWEEIDKDTDGLGYFIDLHCPLRK